MKRKSLIALYVIGLLLLLGVKYMYHMAGSAELDFILAPTARWVTFLSGIPFVRQTDIGYINNNLRFIIAPACSGVQFMLISFAALFLPFVHRIKSVAGKFGWLAGSAAFAYPFTIFVNGFRIVLAIYVPGYLYKWGIYADWLTAERLHTIIGTVVYVAALLAVYPPASLVSVKISRASSAMNETLFMKMVYRFMPPLLCYFAVALGIPFLYNARQNDFPKFLEYAALITAVCLVLLSAYCAAFAIRERLKRIRNKHAGFLWFSCKTR